MITRLAGAVLDEHGKPTRIPQLSQCPDGVVPFRNRVFLRVHEGGKGLDAVAAELSPCLVAELTGTRGQDWQRLTAAAFVSLVVPLIVFFSLQRYFVRGLLAGSTKG